MSEVNINRQTILYTDRQFDVSDFAGKSGVAQPMIYLPAGSKILSGGVDIETVFNPETSIVFTVGDTEGTDDVDKYDSAIDGTVAALSTFNAITSGTIDTAEAVTMTATIVDAAGELDAGVGTLYITYVIPDGRVTELHAYRG